MGNKGKRKIVKDDSGRRSSERVRKPRRVASRRVASRRIGQMLLACVPMKIRERDGDARVCRAEEERASFLLHAAISHGSSCFGFSCGLQLSRPRRRDRRHSSSSFSFSLSLSLSLCLSFSFLFVFLLSCSARRKKQPTLRSLKVDVYTVREVIGHGNIPRTRCRVRLETGVAIVPTYRSTFHEFPFVPSRRTPIIRGTCFVLLSCHFAFALSMQQQVLTISH